MYREAEKEKRKLTERKHRKQTVHDDLEWLGVGNEQLGDIRPIGKQPVSEVPQHDYGTAGSATLSANAASRTPFSRLGS